MTPTSGSAARTLISSAQLNRPRGRILYRVVLAQGGFTIHPPPQARGHFYNLSTKTVEPYRP